MPRGRALGPGRPTPRNPTAVVRVVGMGMLKAIFLGALFSAVIAVVIGSQGHDGGPLAIHRVAIADVRVFWSWPVFVSGTSIFFGLILLQK